MIKEIDVTKSSSVLYLSSRILKDAFTLLPHVLQKIFNLSLSTGIVPDSWKHATIIPLKKWGNSNDVSNLRPISLLPIQGIILEEIVHNRLMNRLEAGRTRNKVALELISQLLVLYQNLLKIFIRVLMKVN